MKTITNILIAVLFAFSNLAYSTNSSSLLPVHGHNDTSVSDEKFVSIKGDIYIINSIDNDAVPVKLKINSRYKECNPVLSDDGNTLYFSSDRKGGYGGMDIWASERLSDGSWCTPYNLGKQINTENDEDNPVVNADGVTLEFTSNGCKGSTERTTYSVTMNDEGVWSNPLMED